VGRLTAVCVQLMALICDTVRSCWWIQTYCLCLRGSALKMEAEYYTRILYPPVRLYGVTIHKTIKYILNYFCYETKFSVPLHFILTSLMSVRTFISDSSDTEVKVK
jgi:hypothetical protein